MEIVNVHTRELAAAPDRAGSLLDGLGGPDDRLWPADRWPTTPFELDGPLAVGTAGRQGAIRQVVEDYEPGRRVVFRFAPGLGLIGTHRLEVEPLGTARTRLSHRLECRVEPKLMPLYPILIRQHDALVEDLLDRAELAATGRVAAPARWPLPVRLANAVEELVTPEIARTWGSTAAERAQPFPCDALLADPDDTLFRAIGVAAPAAVTFRWLCQLRAAPYSYDALDNRGRRSPQQLTPGLDALERGQRVMTIFTLADFEPGRSLTLTHRGRVFGRLAITYRADAVAGDRSRIVVKILAAHAGPRAMRALTGALLPVGDLVMMRRQLLNLKALAEAQSIGTRRPPAKSVAARR